MNFTPNRRQRSVIGYVTALLPLLLICEPTRADSPDVVVVCPQAFTEAMQPWINHRKQEGLKICVIQPPAQGEQLRAAIREAADDQTKYILLVGDAPVIGTTCDPSRQTPILYAPTTVTARWGSPPTLSSDLLYGDFDRDSLPDAAVGRLPVDNSNQLKQWITRIIAREASVDFGPWRSRVQLVGGVGGFGKVADTAIESVARTIVTSMLPTETRTIVTYASPGHPFCPKDETFTDAVLDRYNDGARFWVYAGHGQVTELDRVASSLGGAAVLDRNSVTKLASPPGTAPIAVILACYTGACDAAEDSIAEQMVLTEGGPIAVFAGSRITMPYGNTTAAVGLINGVFHQKLPRLGDAWLNALTEMQAETTTTASTGRMMIDALAAIISPIGTKLVDERHEHMLLYNLLGDPTLKLQHPQSLELSLADRKHDKNFMDISVLSPIAGRLSLTVDRPLGAITDGDPNETTLITMESEIQANQPAKLKIEIPTDVQGAVVIRAVVAGASSWASAAIKTFAR
jgi:hypothetical protein